jgi:predicted RNA binding protein YcfA (HicA-like mRNA interferase family)
MRKQLSFFLLSPTITHVSNLVLGKSKLICMVRRIFNWTYKDVTIFLKENGFTFHEYLGGSHERWIKRDENGGIDRAVEVNIPKGSYPPKTLQTMIKQSGIDKMIWIKWGNS